jgi:hypothetical protein
MELNQQPVPRVYINIYSAINLFVKIWIQYHGVLCSVLSYMEQLGQVVPLDCDIPENTTSTYTWEEN